MNSSNNSGGQSFAERYGKKNSSFTAQAAKMTKTTTNSKSAAEMAAEKKTNKTN